MFVCYTCHTEIPAGEWQSWSCIGSRVPGPNRLPGVYDYEYLDVLGNWWHASCVRCKVSALEGEIQDLREQLAECARHLREAQFFIGQALDSTE